MMKSSEVENEKRVRTIDSTLRYENRIRGAKYGVIVDSRIEICGSIRKVLVKFDDESQPRLVPISRLEIA